jgi:hypothetical protein
MLNGASRSCVFAVFLTVVLCVLATAVSADHQLTLEFRDKDTKQPIAVRVGLFDAAKQPIPPTDLQGQLYQDVPGQSYFYCDGTVSVNVPWGAVTVHAGRGFEYIPKKIELNAVADATVVVELERFVDMKAHRWYSADPHVHISHPPVVYDIQPEQLITAMKAEDLNFVNSMEEEEYFTGALHPASEPDRLLYFSKEQRNAHYSHLAIVGLEKWIPDQGCVAPGMACGHTLDESIYQQVRDQGDALVIAAHPNPTLDFFDVRPWPGGGVWRAAAMDLASGSVDAIDLMCYSNLPPPDGITDYTHALNAGFRIPPAAGTDCTLGSGDSGPPGGYRVYVKPPDGEPFDMESWMEGLRRGRCFVSNYPLFVDFRVAGEMPGGIVRHRDAKLKGHVHVVCADPMERVEIIGDSGVLTTILPPAEGDGREINRSFAIEPTGLKWVAARVVGVAEGWHVMSAGGLFAQTGSIYFELSRSDPGHPGRTLAGYSRGFPKQDAAEHFLARLEDLERLFDWLGYFPGDSRADYETARDEAREYFGRLWPDPPRPFELISPLAVSWAHRGTWVRTVTPEFRWRTASDPDPDDHVTYTLMISDYPSFKNANTISGLADTTFALPDSLKLSDGGIYMWRVYAVDQTGNRRISRPSIWKFVVDLVATGVDNPPLGWGIYEVWPNPFNPKTNITYSVPGDHVSHTLEIFDARGARIRTLFSGRRPAGVWKETWDGRDDRGGTVASGVYFARLARFEGGAAPVSRKLVMLK